MLTVNELVANKQARHNTTLIFRGSTDERILIYEGQSITQNELEKRFPIDGLVGEAAYKSENPDGTHVK
jgi:hypothetical protein